MIFTCCSTALFHQRSSKIHLFAAVRSRPVPPVRREHIKILVSGSSLNIFKVISREGTGILPLSWV